MYKHVHTVWAYKWKSIDNHPKLRVWTLLTMAHSIFDGTSFNSHCQDRRPLQGSWVSPDNLHWLVPVSMFSLLMSLYQKKMNVVSAITIIMQGLEPTMDFLVAHLCMRNTSTNPSCSILKTDIFPCLKKKTIGKVASR